MIRIGNRILANFIKITRFPESVHSSISTWRHAAGEKRKIQSRTIVEKYEILKEIEKGESCAAVSRKHSIPKTNAFGMDERKIKDL